IRVVIAISKEYGIGCARHQYVVSGIVCQAFFGAVVIVPVFLSHKGGHRDKTQHYAEHNTRAAFYKALEEIVEHQHAQSNPYGKGVSGYIGVITLARLHWRHVQVYGNGYTGEEEQKQVHDTVSPVAVKLVYQSQNTQY